MPQLRHWVSATTTTTTTTTTSNSMQRPAAPTTPVRRTRLNSKDHTPTVRRRRLNSRDTTTTTASSSSPYPHADSHNPYAPGISTSSSSILLGWCLVYVTALGLLQLFCVAVAGPTYSTTLLNALHTLLTIVSLHWIKGQPFDDTGSLAGWTLWEQLLVAGAAATDDENGGMDHTMMMTNSNHRRTLQSWLLLVPTLLTYAACVQCHYEPVACLVNLASWVVALVAKLPVMKGVRIFGINRTVGIDDDNAGAATAALVAED